MVVRHRQLALDYWAAISYLLGFLHSLGLEAYTPPELMMRYGLKTGNRFLLMKDEVTDVLYSRVRKILKPLLVPLEQYLFTATGQQEAF